ncbi:MAG: hypothetical protein KBG28_01090 [Kofleriaceae bacterium]|nr:hypothetical protein [Kofleriaceae bacterium]
MPRLLLDERLGDDGAPVRTYLLATSDGSDGAGVARVELTGDDGVGGHLPAAAVATVMARYGRAVETDAALVSTGDELVLIGGTLRRVRFRAVVDADGRDWLTWTAGSAEPVAALATQVHAALRFLLR